MKISFEKKAQVTLYIILGIILLILIVGVVLFFIKTPGSGGTVGVKTDLTVAPIQSFAEGCLYQVGKEAVILAGSQGGYVKPERFGVIANPVMPTAANGVSYFADSETVPYWFYLKSSNTCVQDCLVTSERPPLTDDKGESSIEAQVGKYIEENIGQCLQNITSFEEKNIKSEIIGKPKAKAFAKDGYVELTLKQTIKSTVNGKETKFEEFKNILPVNLKASYELMSNIIALTSDEQVRFFEKKTIHMIGAYGLGDNPEIPPISGGTDFGTTKMRWPLTKVSESLKFMLEDQSSVYSIANTRNSFLVYTEDPTFNGIYNDYIINLQDMKNPENYTIDFVYLQNWPVYLSINPRKGNTIVAEDTKVMGMIPITVKDFYYDLSYPMIITIRDENAFSGEGYTFQAAIEVNIRNNQPINISGGVQGFEAESKSLFCDFTQKKSGDVKVSVVDKDNKPVEEATIMYDCGDESCFLGETDASGSLIDKLPLCANGLVRVQKDDYFSSPKKLSTKESATATIELSAQPYTEVDVTVMKMRLTKQLGSTDLSGWQLAPSTLTPLEPDDKAIVGLSRKPGVGEDEVVESVDVSGIDLAKENKIRLIPGEYEMTATLLTELGPNSMAKKVVRIKVEDADDLVLDSATMTGELTFDSTKGGPITITDSDLKTGKLTIIIPSIAVEDLVVIDDLSNYLTAFEGLSVAHKAEFVPRFGLVV